eukprot:scaffold41282_cov18-Tisochrysis_lutea.AAC.5
MHPIFVFSNYGCGGQGIKSSGTPGSNPPEDPDLCIAVALVTSSCPSTLYHSHSCLNRALATFSRPPNHFINHAHVSSGRLPPLPAHLNPFADSTGHLPGLFQPIYPLHQSRFCLNRALSTTLGRPPSQATMRFKKTTSSQVSKASRSHMPMPCTGHPVHPTWWQGPDSRVCSGPCPGAYDPGGGGLAAPGPGGQSAYLLQWTHGCARKWAVQVHGEAILWCPNAAVTCSFGLVSVRYGRLVGMALASELCMYGYLNQNGVHVSGSAQLVHFGAVVCPS